MEFHNPIMKNIFLLQQLLFKHFGEKLATITESTNTIIFRKIINSPNFEIGKTSKHKQNRQTGNIHNQQPKQNPRFIFRVSFGEN